MHATQLKKRNNLKTGKKWAEDLCRYFSEEDTDGQQPHGKVLSIANF